MEKRKIYLGGLALLVGLLVVSYIMFIKNRETVLDMFEKYHLMVTVDFQREDKIDNFLIDVSYDGKNARVNSSKVNKDSYIIDGKLYYLEGETFYYYNLDKSYLDVYELISTQRKSKSKREMNKVSYYEETWSQSRCDTLLESLFIKGKSSEEATIYYGMKDGKVIDMNVAIKLKEGDGKVNINFTVDELESDYEVNTSRIFGSVGGGRHYKTARTEENVFEVVK